MSLKYSFEALKFANAINNDSLRGVYNMQIGSSYYYINDKKKAIDYFEKSIVYSKKTNNWDFEAMTLNNIGAISIEKKDFEKAEKVLKKSISIFKEHKIQDSKGLLPQRLLATLYTDLKKYDEAEVLYKELISKSKQMKDTSMICFSLVYYATLLEKKGKLKRAIFYDEEALKIQRIQMNKNTLFVILTHLASNYEKDNQYQKAAEFYKEANEINRSIFKEDLKNSVAETEVKYKTAEIKQQKALAEAKTLAEQQKNGFYLFSFLALILILIIVFLIVYVKLQSKRKKIELALKKQQLVAILEAQEEEKVRIARDLHDGICQKFAATKMRFNAISDQLLDNIPEIKVNYKNCISLLDEATNELRSIAHDIMPPAFSELGLVEALRHLTHQTFFQNLEFSFEVFGEKQDFSQNEEINIYRIAQELFANVIKHARATEVSIQMIFSKKQFSLFVEDNGLGFVSNEKIGMGLGNIQLRADLITAKFNIEPGATKGTFASIIKEKTE